MFSWLYGKIADFRNALYDKGVLKSFSLGARTISVGNITFGGTGKTPFVAFVAEVLAKAGEKVCILSRGYGRENARQRVLVSDGKTVLADVRTAGDEPFELANKLLGKAVLITNANRVAAAKWACEKFAVTVFVLDDAFQHRRAKRDLDIVLLDATKPFKILREPLKNLRRADLIVITRANLVDEKQITDYKLQITKLTDAPIFIAENKISNLIKLKDFPAKPQSPQKETLHSPLSTLHSLAFCALGNPNNFFEQLRREGFDLVATQKFPDHHFYTQKDILKLEAKAAEMGAEILLTTAKDAVKLKDLQFNLPCFVAESRMIFDDEKALREIIYAVLNPEKQLQKKNQR